MNADNGIERPDCCRVPSEPTICRCLLHWHPHRRNDECERYEHRSTQRALDRVALNRAVAVINARVVDKIKTRDAIRQAKRQIDLYLQDGERNRLIVASEILDLAANRKLPDLAWHQQGEPKDGAE